MSTKEPPNHVPIGLFYAYAHEDELLRDTLEKHLSLLRRQGIIAAWYDRQILAGDEWARDIDAHLETASIILLLISPDFLASDYCYGIEMRRALERHAAGQARVIPLLVRPVDWESAPFAHLQCLPRDGKPVTEWANQDVAFRDITRGIRIALQELSVPRTQTAAGCSDVSRQRMLDRVSSTWISGVLEHSLHGATLIALGLHEQRAVLANPWRLVVQEVDVPARPLPNGTRISQVYEQSRGSLLILGEPGSGKTTLLLELTRDVLEHAYAHSEDPIPVVFNLSSWAKKPSPLERLARGGVDGPLRGPASPGTLLGGG